MTPLETGLPFLSPLSPPALPTRILTGILRRVHGLAKEIIYAHIKNFTIAINFNIASLYLARTHASSLHEKHAEARFALYNYFKRAIIYSCLNNKIAVKRSV
jgi:hypothetical protein